MARLNSDETGGGDLREQESREQELIECLSPTAEALLEVSMKEEDPLIAQKRIQKRISDRNVTRYSKDSEAHL